MRMEEGMRGSGNMGREMDLALSTLRMETSFMELLLLESQEGKVYMYGLVGIDMKEDFQVEGKKDLDIGLRKTSTMLVSGDLENRTVMEFSRNQIVQSMKENGACI